MVETLIIFTKSELPTISLKDLKSLILHAVFSVYLKFWFMLLFLRMAWINKLHLLHFVKLNSFYMDSFVNSSELLHWLADTKFGLSGQSKMKCIPSLIQSWTQECKFGCILRLLFNFSALIYYLTSMNMYSTMKSLMRKWYTI